MSVSLQPFLSNRILALLANSMSFSAYIDAQRVCISKREFILSCGLIEFD